MSLARNMRSATTVRALLVCSALSVLVWVYVLWAGLNQAPDPLPTSEPYVAYFQTINWWPFPLFFLLLIPVTHLTWRSFMGAWRDLADTDVLVNAQGGPPTEEEMTALDRGITGLRKWAVLVAVLSSVLINVIDTRQHAGFFFGSHSLARQVDVACTRPTSWTKWVFVAETGLSCADARAGVEHGADAPGIRAPGATLAFALMTLVQQFLIVFFVAFVMAQLLLHAIAFGAFERLLPDLHKRGLRLRLNPNSPMREFGLERWNYVLNDFYWYSCPVLLLVYLSRSSVDEALYDPGQRMLGIVVPALLLVPMVVTIFARQARLPEVWDRLRAGEEDATDRHHQQQLWPLDRNWSAKLGIILAFALAALSLGDEAIRFLGVAG